MTTRKAVVGESVRVRWLEPEQADYLVQPPCALPVGGRHYCATHPDADTRNNLMMSNHVDGPGRHVEVWICDEHGPEVP